MLKTFNNNNRGSALVMVMLVIIIVPIIIFALFSLSVSENQLVNREHDDQKAYYLARSGAAATANWIEQQSVETVNDFFKDEKIKSIDWQSLEKEIPGELDVEVNYKEDEKNENYLVITSRGHYDGKKRIVKLKMLHHNDLNSIFESSEFFNNLDKIQVDGIEVYKNKEEVFIKNTDKVNVYLKRLLIKNNEEIAIKNKEKVNIYVKELEIENNEEIVIENDDEINIYLKKLLIKNNEEIAIKNKEKVNIYVEELEIKNNEEIAIKNKEKANIYFKKIEIKNNEEIAIKNEKNLNIYVEEFEKENSKIKNNEDIGIENEEKFNIYFKENSNKYKIDYWY